tara:strand:+ start:1335 stop:2219 length:885 start_codon:yes stop_codon:yes gene_type:complete
MIFERVSPVFQKEDDQGSAEPAPVEAPAPSGEASESGGSPFAAVKYTGSDGKERTIESEKQLQNHLSHLSNQASKAADVQRREQELARRMKEFDSHYGEQTAQIQKIRAELDAKNKKLGQLPGNFWDTVDQQIAEGQGPQGVEERLTRMLDERFSKVDEFISSSQEERERQQRVAETQKQFEEIATELSGEYADFDREHAQSFIDKLTTDSNDPASLTRRLMMLAHESRLRPSAQKQGANQVKAAAERARAKLASPGRGMAQGKGPGPAKDKRGRVSIEAARQRAHSRAEDVLE